MPLKKILIAEDDVLISEQLSAMIRGDNFEVVGIAYDYNSAIDLLKSKRPDIAILDIRMQGEEVGFQIASHINEHYQIPYLFLSSHSDPSTLSKAVEFHPDSYITKPFTKEQVLTGLKMASTKQKEQRSIVLKHGTENQKIAVQDILWMKSEGVYVELHTKQKRMLIRTSLKAFIDEHQINELIPIHRAYAVNIKNVESISKTALTINNAQLPIARSQKQTVHAAFYDSEF